MQQEAGGREPGAAWAAGAWSLPLQTEVWGAGLHGRIASETPPGPTHSKGQTLGTWVYPSMVQAGRRLRLALGVTGSPAPSPLPLSSLLPPGSPVPGILQARTLEWVAISFSSA